MPDIIADKYEVLETIGRGGMGTVYKARQTNLDRIVAIKMLSEELASDPEFRARFQQEATVVARLNHPNIVQVHDIEAHNNTFCIIMEYVDGENLQAKIDRDVTLPEKEVVTIGAQVARALAYAHSRGVIHRDIKPDNIHVTPKGVAKVMDFGIARYMDSKLKTQTGISMGTPKFMSPEQVTGKNVDGQTDLYSLGVCLYYCLSGRPPFDGENAISVATRHLYEQPEPPSKLNSSISPAVEKVILHSMEKQKQNRYGTGIEMAEALEATLGIKTPVRAGLDADEKFGGATTQKMPSQGLGTPGSAPIGSIAAAPADNGASSPPITPASSEARMTPLSTRSVPQLEPEFRTPRAELRTQDSTRSFNRSLIIFGGLVIIAAILLITLVIWLRRNTDANPGVQTGQVESTQADRVRATVMEADTLARDNQPVKAYELLEDFKKKHQSLDNDSQAALETRLNALLNQFPENPETASALGSRRKNIAGIYTNKHSSMAAAYYNAALAIDPDLANTGVTTFSLNQLEILRSNAADIPDNVRLAEEYFTSGTKATSAGAIAQAKDAFIHAVELNYRKPQYWEALGDYFSTDSRKDDARVMYREAITQAKDPSLRDKLESKLKALQN